MPKSLSKVTKHITKKKGKLTHLHANSRDSRRILRASARDSRVEKGALLREKQNEHFVVRVEGIRALVFPELIETGEEGAMEDDESEVVREGLSGQDIKSVVDEWVARLDEDLECEKASRRAGRPKSAREEMLGELIERERKEYQTGFWIPDLQSQKNLKVLKKWNGQWVGLNNVDFIRVKQDGAISQSSWPPTGKS